jgi:hypothetical protein
MKLAPRSQQCTWDSGISFDGLNLEDRRPIREIGFDAWLDETIAPKPSRRSALRFRTSGRRGYIGTKLIGRLTTIGATNTDRVHLTPFKEHTL